MRSEKRQNPSPQVPVYVDEVEVGVAEVPVPWWVIVGVVVAIGIALYAVRRRR